MGMLLGVLLGVIGVILIYAGLSGHEANVLQLLFRSITIQGVGSVGPPMPGEDSKHRRPGDPGYNPNGN